MILKLLPIFSEKVWGGDNLKNYGFKLPNNSIGEAWLISGYKDKQTIIKDYDVKLNEFYKKNRNYFNNYDSENFPLLIKLLDANNDLSIQVHPDDKTAKFLEKDESASGKSEAWYVLSTKNNEIIISTTTRNTQQTKELLDKKQFLKLINTIKINNEDYLNIEPGTVHAIKSKTIIYEVQQSSDLTYRLYDYDRLENGKLRDLHIDKSLASIKYNEGTIIQQPTKNYESNSVRQLMIQNSRFCIEEWGIDNSRFSVDKKHHFLAGTNIGDTIFLNDVEINSFESFIVTVDELKDLSFKGSTKLLISYPK